MTDCTLSCSNGQFKEIKVSKVHISAVAKNHFVDVLTLVFMVKNVELNLIPRTIQPPRVVNEREFLFTQTAQYMQLSLEISGLKDSLMVSSAMIFINL